MIESQFEELKAVVERAMREVTEILEGEEKQALKQAEGIRVHLEQRCTELKKTQTQVEKLSKNKNDVDFLQVTPSRWRLAPCSVLVSLVQAQSCAATISNPVLIPERLFCLSDRSIQNGRKKPLTFLCLASTSA